MDAFTLLTLFFVLIYFALIIGSFFFKALKTVLKIFTLICTVLFVISLVFGYFIYKDVKEFQQRSLEAKSFFLEEDGKLLAGFVQENQNISVIKEGEMIRFDGGYSAGDYDAMLGKNYKMFIVKSVFFNPNKSVSMKQFSSLDVGIKYDDMLYYLRNGKFRGSNPFSQFGIPEEEMKSRIFSIMLMSELSDDPTSLIFALKNGNILIYKETISFKIIKQLPDSVVDKVKEVQNGIYG
jgi:uncharacterized membrane protein